MQLSVLLSQVRRWQCNAQFTHIENRIIHVCKLFHWLACTCSITASSLCALHASHLQHKMPSATVASIQSHINYVRLFKTFGTLITFQAAPEKGSAAASILGFSEAGRANEYGELCYFSGLLLDLWSKTAFYTLSWISH